MLSRTLRVALATLSLLVLLAAGYGYVTGLVY
jgi:hypothetical protein